MKPLPYILQGKNIVVVIDNKPYTITESNLCYTALKEAIRKGQWDLVPDLACPKKAIEKYVKDHFECIDGVLYENGVQVSSAISERMYSMYSDGFSIQPLLNFYKNIKDNPSKESAAELYGFLEKNSLPITEDGCFIAYKRVRADYSDCYTGRMDNSIGKVVSMDRTGVSQNRNDTCSSGLHFCSYSYLEHFGGGRIVTVKVNPVDVVSIPVDYDNAKGRCCKYEVIGELDNNIASDELAEVSVYVIDIDDDYNDPVYDEIDHSDEDEPDQIHIGTNFNLSAVTVDLTQVYSLGLRKQAEIWNHLTDSSLKKFSDRESCDRRMYQQYRPAQIIAAAKELGLV